MQLNEYSSILGLNEIFFLNVLIFFLFQWIVIFKLEFFWKVHDDVTPEANIIKHFGINLCIDVSPAKVLKNSTDILEKKNTANVFITFNIAIVVKVEMTITAKTFGFI